MHTEWVMSSQTRRRLESISPLLCSCVYMYYIMDSIYIYIGACILVCIINTKYICVSTITCTQLILDLPNFALSLCCALSNLKGKVIASGYIIIYYMAFCTYFATWKLLHRIYKVPFIQRTLYYEATFVF